LDVGGRELNVQSQTAQSCLSRQHSRPNASGTFSSSALTIEVAALKRWEGVSVGLIPKWHGIAKLPALPERRLNVAGNYPGFD